ncbi:MAG: deoxyribodipyrimidine photo-lyase, partial [Actinomycetales bacterium]
MACIMWFRRDLRLRDNPALLTAIDQARATGDDRVIGLFVLDPARWEPSGPIRQAYLLQSLTALNRSMGGSLHVVRGDPRQVVPKLMRTTGATSVH